MRRLFALLLTFGLLLGVAPALAKPPVWVLHGRGATITLFGSVHVLPRGLDWEPAALQAAVRDADELWFETPIDPASLLDASRLALAKGMLPEGQTLHPLLSEDGRKRLDDAAADLRLPAPQLDRLRPWLAELTISSAATAKLGATADQGVERQLAAGAARAKRRAFETVSQQIAMFAGTSTAVQVDSLEDTLKDLQEDPEQPLRLIDGWMRGDLTVIDKEGVQELKDSSPVLFKILVTNRNAAWNKVLLKRLKSRPPRHGRPARIVVVVGVGHLAGAGGLPTMLRKQGVRVDGPKG